MRYLHRIDLLVLHALSAEIGLSPVAAEEEFSCRQGRFGTHHCRSEEGTTIESRPDLLGNTNSTITDPDGGKIRCRSSPDLFGPIYTVCE
jgi:hypothetical protein